MNASRAGDNDETPLDGTLPIDEADIIDVSEINFDEDTWLCASNQACGSTNVHPCASSYNLEPEDLYLLKASRKSIDTRTYTRTKRRSNRPSFESVLNNLASPIAPQKTDFNLHPCSTPLPFKLKEAQEESNSIPHMLRPNFKTYTTFTQQTIPTLSATGHESMEAFLNVSQSRGVDSFINISEPEFHDDLMSISQPSVFGSSLITTSSLMTTSSKEETSLSTDILTNSMMQSSMFNEVKDVLIPFEMENLDSTVKMNSERPVNDNQLPQESNDSKHLDNMSQLSLIGDATMRSEATFLSISLSDHLNEEDKQNSLPDLDSQNSSSKTIVPENSTSFVNSSTDSARRTTFFVKNSTFQVESPPEALNRTFDRVLPDREDLNRTFDATEEIKQKKKLGSTFVREVDQEREALNATFETEKQTPEDTKRAPPSDLLNATFEAATLPDVCQMEPPRPKVVTSLRHELLKEARRAEGKRADTTFDMSAQKENFERQQANLTFVKGQKATRLGEKNQLDRKLTFTVKNNNTFVKDAGDLNSTFLKSDQEMALRKPQRRLMGPTIFSKAPGYLQKSNPNLVSGSLNTVNSAGSAGRPGLLKYSRGSQPNIAATVQKSSLGRFKGGSEQRLKDGPHAISDFHLAAAASGSTESIESTQSAHSAPDLDDRLSNCSENSRGSYTIGRMDSDELHKIAQLQEESLRHESTPKINRHDDEFMKHENLPSPIAKHGEREDKFPARKPNKPEFETSSPNESPSALNQTITLAGTASKPPICQMPPPVQNIMKNTEMPRRQSKIVAPVEVKSKLRQPTNFNSANRPASAASGIPRPMSRIPAPKSSRPKTAQSDLNRRPL